MVLIFLVDQEVLHPVGYILGPLQEGIPRFLFIIAVHESLARLLLLNLLEEVGDVRYSLNKDDQLLTNEFGDLIY